METLQPLSQTAEVELQNELPTWHAPVMTRIEIKRTASGSGTTSDLAGSSNAP